jgi:type II secretory pathway pseudopilin PulG
MDPSERTRGRRGRGVTPIEPLIVVAVVGALAAGAGSGVLKARADADRRLAHDEVQTLSRIAEAYRLLGDAPICPNVVQLEQSKLLRGSAHARDPWGTRYEVVCQSHAVNVRSLGPDRKRGTPDDIARF